MTPPTPTFTEAELRAAFARNLCAASRRATSIAAVKKIIAVVNRSKKVSRRDFELMVAACNVQIRRDVAPLWGYTPWSVKAYTSESRLPKRCLPIRIVDDPQDVDDEGAFGWHFEEDNGQPIGRVFVNSILSECKVKSELPKWIRRHPRGVSVILSHEVVEAFIDPDINLWAYDPKGQMHSYEACDPVQAHAYVISVPGGRVHVSNFVSPAWFDAENRSGTRYDHMKKLKKPFKPAANGYTTVVDATAAEVVLWGYKGKLSTAKKHRAARTALRCAKGKVCRKHRHPRVRGR